MLDWFKINKLKKDELELDEDKDDVTPSAGFHCTYCGGDKFYEGPSGGSATNILCANPNCRHWFNDMGPFGIQDLNKIEPTAAEQAAKIRNDEVLAHNKKLEVFEEGRKLYHDGKPALDCVSNTGNNEYGFYSAAGEDLVKLAGWITASQEKKAA